jgi:hypothetical protein
VALYPGLTVEQARQLHVARPAFAVLGDLLLLGLVVYLWRFKRPSKTGQYSTGVKKTPNIGRD